MTKLKLSAKMHIIVIVSAVIIAVGLAVGLICQFCADGYFNYGGDYKDYQTVEINYTSVEYKDKEITISTQHEKIQTFIARIDVCSILAVEGRRRYVAVATDARAAFGRPHESTRLTAGSRRHL